MIRSLLATTATLAVLAAGAHAQEAGTQQEQQGQQQQGQQQQQQQGQGNGELQLEAVQQDTMQPGATGGAAGTGTGQEVIVNSGDTIVIQPSGDGTFTLNFRFDQAGGTAAGPAGGAQTGQAGMPAPADQTATAQGDQMQPADPEQMSTESLMGSEVYGVNDENIGNVSDVLLNEDGQVEAIVVDVGGFLGIGAHPVSIGTDGLRFMVDQGQNWFVFTPFTQEQLEAQPAYDPNTYAQERDQQRMVVQSQ